MAERRKIQFGPVIGLFFAAPLVAEFLLGNLPIKLLPALIVLAPMYGGGAVLIREIVRRSGRGWPSILLLGMAYGIFEEAFVTQSLFNPNYLKLNLGLLTPAFIPELGISAWWTLWMLMVHGIWSISTPIALIESCVPDYARTPWLGRVGLCIVAIVFLAGSTAAALLGYKTDKFLAGTAQFIGAALVIVVLVILAFLIPVKRGPWRRWNHATGLGAGDSGTGIGVGRHVCSEGMGMGRGGCAAGARRRHAAGGAGVDTEKRSVARVSTGARRRRCVGLWTACVCATTVGRRSGCKHARGKRHFPGGRGGLDWLCCPPGSRERGCRSRGSSLTRTSAQTRERLSCQNAVFLGELFRLAQNFHYAVLLRHFSLNRSFMALFLRTTGANAPASRNGAGRGSQSVAVPRRCVFIAQAPVRHYRARYHGGRIRRRYLSRERQRG